MQEFARLLVRWKPDLIAGYTNVIYLFAQLLVSRNITGIRPRFVETTANQLWPHERALIEQVFQCPVSDRYGSNESGSVVVAECPEGNRHIFSDFCHVELLVDGRPANPGEVGEAIATPLYAFGMPLIRFRLGDAAIPDDRRCPCGRGLPLLRDLVGRISSIFTLPSGRLLYGGAFEVLVLKDTLAIRKFRVHQHASNQIEVFLEKGERFDGTIVELIRSRCLRLLDGEPVALRIQVVDEIPSTPGGKHLATLSDVPVQLT
jgi:phenylacetate-CoA ligase